MNLPHMSEEGNQTGGVTRTFDQYVGHDNRRRPHRALQLRSPRSDRPVVNLTHERIERRSVLGGLMNEYERAA